MRISSRQWARKIELEEDVLKATEQEEDRPSGGLGC